MIDFATLQGLAIPEGVVTQIADASGMVIWAVSGGKVILEVEKITSDTYAGETTYTGEQFILLDIYPKTNGTVSVTYGGLTKTITDTSGAAEPNAQQVFFGTFNGVSDSVETPASGTLTIEGDCLGFGGGAYAKSSKDLTTPYCLCITEIASFGEIQMIPDYAFSDKLAGCEITEVDIPKNVISIGVYAFSYCKSLISAVMKNGLRSIGDNAFISCTSLDGITIPASVTSIGRGAFSSIKETCFISIENGNTTYKIDGNCLIEIATNKILSGFIDSVIPMYVTSIGSNAFQKLNGLTSITIPASVTDIGASAFTSTGLTNVTIPASVTSIGETAFMSCANLTSVTVLASTPPVLGYHVTSGVKYFQTFLGCDALTKIVVPKGCSAIYKSTEGWDGYADYITEAS